MPAAVITDTELNTVPINRRTDFYASLNTALINAGYSSGWFDEYDLTDGYAKASNSNNVFYDANANGALIAKVKSFNAVLPYGATKSFHQVFFTRCDIDTGFGSTALTDNRFLLGNSLITGGWDATTHYLPAANTLTTSSSIGGYGCVDIKEFVSNREGEIITATIPLIAVSSGANVSRYSGNLSFNPNVPEYSSNYNLNSSTTCLTGIGRGDVGINKNLPVKFKSINHPEIRGVIVYQLGGGVSFIGYISPAIKPSWWVADSFPYIFLPKSTSFFRLYGFANSRNPWNLPQAEAFCAIQYPSYVVNRNPLNNNKRSVWENVTINNRFDICGRFSSDIVGVVTEFSSFLDTFTIGGSTYLVLGRGTPTLAIKIS